MDKDNEIELVNTIQEKDRRIKELEAMNENIGRELLARTDELNEVLEKIKDSIPKDEIRKKAKEYLLKTKVDMPFNIFSIIEKTKIAERLTVYNELL